MLKGGRQIFAADPFATVNARDLSYEPTANG